MPCAGYPAHGPLFSMKPYLSIRQACRAAWQRGLLSGFNGNVSLRQGSAFHITCSGAAKGFLRPEDVALVSLQTPDHAPGQLLEGGRPSSEMPMHLAVYAAAPETCAIVHCHPRHLLALELKVGLEDFLCLPLFEADMLRARLAVAPALPPGSQALAEAVGEAARHAEAVWMSRHGLTCRAQTLLAAVALAEELDHLAAVQLLALRG